MTRVDHETVRSNRPWSNTRMCYESIFCRIGNNKMATVRSWSLAVGFMAETNKLLQLGVAW